MIHKIDGHRITADSMEGIVGFKVGDWFVYEGNDRQFIEMRGNVAVFHGRDGKTHLVGFAGIRGIPVYTPEGALIGMFYYTKMPPPEVASNPA